MRRKEGRADRKAGGGFRMYPHGEPPPTITSNSSSIFFFLFSFHVLPPDPPPPTLHSELRSRNEGQASPRLSGGLSGVPVVVGGETYAHVLGICAALAVCFRPPCDKKCGMSKCRPSPAGGSLDEQAASRFRVLGWAVPPPLTGSSDWLSLLPHCARPHLHTAAAMCCGLCSRRMVKPQ